MTLTRNMITALFMFAISQLTQADAVPESELGLKGDEPKNIAVASIDWCPYICVGQEKPGILVEYVRKIFAGTPYNLSFTHMPWGRAIHETQMGSFQALLAPAKEEAPGLIYPKHPLGYQHMCLFTHSDDPWRYNGLNSLKGRRIVYVYDGYPASLEGAQDLAVFYPMPYNEAFISRGVKMVLNQRTDTLLFTRYSTQQYLNLNGLADKMQVAGCVQRQAVYLAFTPSDSARETREALISLLDGKIETLQKENTFESLLRDYGLTPSE